MKKGFTLIELLAVIVILAVIAIIAVPIVLNIINDAKESSVLRSAEFYLKGVETSIATSILKNITITDGTYSIMQDGNICLGTLSNNTCTGDILKMELDGSKPTTGTIEIENGSIKNIELTLSDKTIIKNSKSELVFLKKLNDICKPAKKQFFATNPLEEGYEYECEVKPGTKYNFYVLSMQNKSGDIITESSIDNKVVSINLIMDRNINSDGTPATEPIEESQKNDKGGIYNLVAWINQDDYGTLYPYDEDMCWEEDGCILNNKGPVTAMKFLDNATSDWSNIPNLNLSYNDDGENFTNFKITGKARLPYEVGDYDSDEVPNAYLYDNLHAICYDNEEDLNPVACKDAGYMLADIKQEGMEYIHEIYGYWTFSSFDEETSLAWYVASGGLMYGSDVFYAGYGVRPVINLKL